MAFRGVSNRESLGKNIEHLILDRSGEPHCLRLHKYGILRLGVVNKVGNTCRPTNPRQPRNPLRQVQQKWQFQAAHHRPRLRGVYGQHILLRFEIATLLILSTNMGENKRRDAILVLEPHREGASALLERIPENIPEHQGVIIFGANGMSLQ